MKPARQSRSRYHIRPTHGITTTLAQKMIGFPIASTCSISSLFSQFRTKNEVGRRSGIHFHARA